MRNNTLTKTSDPLAAFTAGAFTPDRKPVPLVSTRFDVEIIGGLAVVETVRTFRNDEPVTIEATITFPVPVHAALYRLQASVDGRRLIATAKARMAAREAYEDAVEQGKAAVLHEEILKGVHTLSVAHIAPGTEIEIATTWVASLSLVGSEARLRVPLTVGDIYGRSGLNEADDLITGGASSMAQLRIRSDAGEASVAGVALVDGVAEVPLDAPIDLVIADWSPVETTGVTADGRVVRLSVQPAAPGDGSLDVAILVDHSGSMGSKADGGARRSGSKHEAAVKALSAYSCRPGDTFDLWQFDTDTSRVGEITIGEAKATGLRKLAAQLEGPRGGTEIGGALETVLANSKARDILLITDGQSYALDVQTLATHGRRISVILVGEDSLDAKVGHLAALTGGDIWVAADAEIGSVMQAGIDSLRARAKPVERVAGSSGPQDLILERSGLRIEASWSPSSMDADLNGHPAVAPFATSLVLSTLPEGEAAELAAAEGLVTHLTSLVLVDEASAVQEDIPLLRKVALPSPRSTGGVWFRRLGGAAASTSDLNLSMASVSQSSSSASVRSAVPPDLLACYSAAIDSPSPEPSDEWLDISALRAMAEMIDWGQSANALAQADLGCLSRWQRELFAGWCATPGLQELADALGIDMIRLLIAAVAYGAIDDRHAQRVVKRLATTDQIEALVRFLRGEGPATAVSFAAPSDASPQMSEGETVGRRLMRSFLGMKTKPIDLS